MSDFLSPVPLRELCSFFLVLNVTDSINKIYGIGF